MCDEVSLFFKHIIQQHTSPAGRQSLCTVTSSDMPEQRNGNVVGGVLFEAPAFELAWVCAVLPDSESAARLSIGAVIRKKVTGPTRSTSWCRSMVRLTGV